MGSAGQSKTLFISPGTRERKTKLLCPFLCSGGSMDLWFYRFATTTMAFGWLLVAVVSQSQPTVYKRFPFRSKELHPALIIVWTTSIRLLTNPILCLSFSLDDGHPRLTRLLRIHKLFFEHRRTPLLGLGRINVVPKLERSREAGAVVERQTPSLGAVLKVRQSSRRKEAITTSHYAFENKVFFR